MGTSRAHRRHGPSRPVLLAASLLVCLRTSPVDAASCINDFNVCDGDGEAYRPIGGCKYYAHCVDGKLASKFPCAEGAIYDVLVKRCNWEHSSFCIPKSCPPTPAPSASPSESPTAFPSASPSESPTDWPSASPSASPTDSPTIDFFLSLDTDEMKMKFELSLLLSYNPAGISYPSTKYSFEGLIDALRQMVLGITSDGRMFRFYTSSYTPNSRMDYGLTNLAAFLAMAMTESIARDTCDEFNTDSVADRYAVSNSCGQNMRSYQDEVCTKPEERDMSCPVDVNMEMTSSGYSTGIMGRAPPPFSCRPKTSDTDYAGYWDGQTGASSKTAYANALGRTDLEGCCWWGRGALLTRNVCNIGKLNYYLGKRAFDERGEGKFPTVDFCVFPEATCANEEGKEGTEEIKWITGLFEWIERIQQYSGWDYIGNLEAFVDGGMTDEIFIDTVSSIFTLDCHEEACARGEVTMKEERRANFMKVLQVFGLPKLTAAPTLSRPRPPPTPNPTTEAPVTPSPVKTILPPPLVVVPPPAPVPYPTVEIMPSDMQPVTDPFADVGEGPTQPSPFRPTTTTPPRTEDPTDNIGLIAVEDNSASLVGMGIFWSAALGVGVILFIMGY